MTTALAPFLASIKYDDLLEIVRLRSGVKDFRTINRADHKARGILSQNGAAWQDVVCANHNALTRGIRKLGWIELDAFTVACAAVEEATVGALARESLEEDEFRLLTAPVGRAVAPWLLDGSEAPEIAPEVTRAATDPVAGSLVKAKVKKPTKAPIAPPPVATAEEMDPFQEENDDPFGLAALDELAPAEPPVQVSKPRSSLFQRAQ